MIRMAQIQSKVHQTSLKRKINKHSTADFQLNLRYETWEPVFDGNGVNRIFSSSLNTFLRIFLLKFPLVSSRWCLEK
jgi:hypothetical protein